MTKLFSHAGVSRTGTVMKVRWCNGADRVKALIKDGQKDIDIVELPSPMDKDSAVLLLLSINFDNGNAEVRSVLEAEATKRGLEGYVVEKVDLDKEIVAKSAVNVPSRIRLAHDADAKGDQAIILIDDHWHQFGGDKTKVLIDIRFNLPFT